MAGQGAAEQKRVAALVIGKVDAAGELKIALPQRGLQLDDPARVEHADRDAAVMQVVGNAHAVVERGFGTEDLKRSGRGTIEMQVGVGNQPPGASPDCIVRARDCSPCCGGSGADTTSRRNRAPSSRAPAAPKAGSPAAHPCARSSRGVASRCRGCSTDLPGSASACPHWHGWCLHPVLGSAPRPSPKRRAA